MPRSILPKWNRPAQSTLKGVYPSGKPQFDPFPTVTELTNAYHCPLAIFHYLLHGEAGAFMPRGTAEAWRAGDIFHGFIGRLKRSIMEGEETFRAEEETSGKLHRIWLQFTDFAKNIDRNDIIWSEYVQPWALRKLDELSSINLHSKVYFEITASCNYVRFATEDAGSRTYPLVGRIDEIDLDGKRLIERTIKATPALKDYQLWLLWKALCSIDRSKYPEGWKGVDFNEFELVVETPHNDFPVPKSNPMFERKTHDCYAWIHDLTFEPKAVWEAYNERSCTYDKKKEECGLAWMCYAARQPFPSCRDEMRRKFKDMYKALLWEKMWATDLLQYRFASMPEKELEDRGLLCRGKPIPGTRRDNTFQVLIPAPQVGLIGAKVSDEVGNFMIVFGNMSMGQRLKATLERSPNDQNVFSLRVENYGGFTIFGDPLIATVGEDLLVFEDRPTYLITGIQRGMHNLEYRGAKNQSRAEEDSKIQLLEGVFGRKRIKKARS